MLMYYIVCLTIKSNENNEVSFLSPFLKQSDLSVETAFSTEAQIGLSDTVEKGLFRLNFFRLSFPTGESSRKSQLFRLDPAAEKLSRKSFTLVF